MGDGGVDENTGLARRLGVYSVSEVTAHIKGLLEGDVALQDAWVEGEISDFTRAVSGHVYFTLKDEASQIRCVLWRRLALRQGRLPQDGETALVHGRVSVYEVRGAYQLYVDLVSPLGRGLLHLQYEELRQRLEAEGLFAPEHKRPLPPFPKVLGVVTSPVGAALQDILKVLARRYRLAEVILAPALVQGDEAPPQIVAALEGLNRYSDVEAIIVARGGGSPEELWAFNDEEVARAIFRSRAPVIAGIGHQTDFTLADFVADARAPTPSAAAEMAVPDGRELAERATLWRAGLVRLVQGQLEGTQQSLAWQVRLLLRLSPQTVVDRERQRLDEMGQAMRRRLLHHLALRRERISGLRGRLENLEPHGILQRGYAVVRHRTTGRVVRSVQDAAPSAPLTVTVTDGSFPAKVEEV
jgi:exodeoxyribonuclease VII large subunit